MRRLKNSLLRFYRNLSIRNKIFLILNIQILIPLFILGYMSYQNTSKIVQQNAIQYSQDVLTMMEQRIGDYIWNLNLISQDLLYDQTVNSVLENTADAFNPIESYENESSIKKILKRVIYTREEIQSICFITSEGTYFDQDDTSKDLRIKEILPYQELLDLARSKEGKPVWVMDEYRRIYMARTVNNTDTFEENALMVMLLNRDYIEELTGGFEKNMWNITILTSSFQKIAERTLSLDTVFQHEYVENIEPNTRGYKINHDKDLFISYITIREANWLAVAYVPLKYLYKDAYLIRQRFILLSIISVFIMSVLSVYIGLDLVNPINKLVRAMKRMHEGEAAKVELAVDREDEFGFLNLEFNKMSSRIHYLVHSVYRQQIANKDAQLKALQAQINPHFLFNTLESINWTAQLNNVPRISEMVSALSTIMEAGIGRDNRPIPIVKEMEYIDKYIFIMKQRFEDQLEYRKEIEPGVDMVRVPKLIIQPLIENAVYHGIEKTSRKGFITVNARRKDEIVIINVIDNGRGMRQRDLEVLNERLNPLRSKSEDINELEMRKSIGIENVSQRIKLFYGDEYGLEIFSRYGCYTKITVTIPYQVRAEGQHV